MNDFLKGTSLYLIGMMGSGKTTVGQVLAQKLAYKFFDTDQVIEQVAGQPIHQIFARQGEREFRQLETQVLSELSAYKELVIATGGGIILEQMNWSYLRHGIIIWLNVSVDQLSDRLKEDSSRPLLQNTNRTQTLQTILNQRQHLYAQADIQLAIAPNDTPEAIAFKIMEAIQSNLKPATTPPQYDGE